MRRLLISISVVFFISNLNAKEVNPNLNKNIESLTINDIMVENNKRVEKEAILARISSKKGELINKDKIKRDIISILELGFFWDVSVKVKNISEDKKADLVFYVKEIPAIKSIKIEGNEEIDKEEIEKVITIKINSPFDINKIRGTAQKIKELYIEKGFFLSEVSYQPATIEEAIKEDTVELKFIISEHSKVIVKNIHFSGTSKVKPSELKSIMETREGGWFSFITGSGTYKEDAFQKDMMRITQYYRERGFIKARVGTPSLKLTPDKKFLLIFIPIEEGEQYRLGDIKISGDLIVEEKEIRKLITLKKGDIFNTTQFFARDLEAISVLYKDMGYAYVNIETPYKENENQRILDFELIIEKGPVCKFEKIEIIGNTKTRDKVIRREMIINEYDTYSHTALETSKRRIEALGYFEKVEYRTHQGSASHLVNVEFEVKEKATGTFNVGAGFSSAENFLVQAQIGQYNLLGNGQSLSLTALISSIRKIFELSFTEPYFFDTNWTFALDLYNTSWNYYEFYRSSTGFRITTGYPINYNLRTYITYTLEDVSVESGVSFENQRRIKNLYSEGITSSITLKLIWDSRNNRIYPSRGQFHSISTEIASTLFGSENEFVRTYLKDNFYFQLPYYIVIKAASTIGYITPFGSSGIPISERFYVGGIYSIRGFTLRSISPFLKVAKSGIDPSSELDIFYSGGNKQLIFNVELEFPIIQQAGIRGVFFFDSGNTYDEKSFFFDDPYYDFPLGLLYSWGFGFRWFSPMGPLRFEWGFPITRRTHPNTKIYIDDSFKFEFTIGSSF
ncbi:MAG: outer membrane protein assembly factor BamA [Deltaproteobacteria bacterium]|nr:outer membrane protein assembly factor BamA [Deltaproteobacteria bacterium]